MATEANARARAAVDLKNLLRRITSTSSFVLEAYVTSGPTEVDRLWECLHILLEGCDIGEDCIVLSASLLNAGAVDTLVGLMLEFPSSTCSEPPTPWLISTERSTWDWAFRSLAWLVEYLRDDPSDPSINTATSQLRRRGAELMKSLLDNPIFSNGDPSSKIMEFELADYRDSCLGIISSILQVPPPDEAPSPTSLEHIKAAVPLLVAMRRTIKPTRSLAASYDADTSAQLLAKCLGALGWPTGYSYDITQKASVSYDELVRQCCEATNNTIDQVGSATKQLFLITKLRISVGNDTSRMNKLIDSLINRRYVTFAARTMLNMEASQDPRVKHDTDRRRNIGDMDAQDTSLFVLPALLRRAEEIAAVTPANEAIQSHLLFILENHSHSAIKFAGESLSQLDLIYKIACSVFSLLSKYNKPLFPRAAKQLRIIVTRTAQRKARPAVSRLWSNLYTMVFLYGFALSEEPAMICSTPGCTSLDDAKMSCAKCKTRYYCSKACQTRDWRAHKRECKRSA